MDRPTSLEGTRIDLALERPFKLGGTNVDPAAHEITWGSEARRLQPQTLKVLVALHDKAGEVVTRGELVNRCWDGRFVGDDVINRCISLLRRVATESGGIEIQTVPRGGYRLLEAQPGCSNDRASVAQSGALHFWSSPRGKWLAAALNAVGLLIAVSGLFEFRQLSRRSSNAVLLRTFDVAGDAASARTLAAGVSSDVAGALSAAGVDVVVPDASGQSRKAAFILDGRAELPGTELHLTAELQDARDHTVLWSTSFTRSASELQSMQEQVAANLAAVLHCALDTSREADGEMDQDSIKLYLKACALQQSSDPPLDQIADLLKQVTARQPRFAVAWARLALSTASQSFTARAADANRLRADARAAAQTALRINPKLGIAYEALADVELGRVPFAQLHREFQNALKLDPNNADILDDDGQLLMRMGSADEALHLFRRSVELDPLSAQYASDLISGLINDGHDTEARAVLQRAARLWPDDNTLKIVRANYEVRFGNPAEAVALLDDPVARPEQVRDVTLETFRQLAEARQSHSPGHVRAFIRLLKTQVASGRLGVDFASPQLARLGDVDGAFEMAFAAPPDVINIDPEFLWEPESLALRRNPRFIELAAKFHVSDFWASTGLWPDFCSTPGWPYNCKTQLERSRLSKP